MRSVCLHADVDGLLLNAYNTSVADDRPSVRVLLGAVLRDNFLIDGESRNICWEFLADLLADMLPGIAAESKGFPVVSLEQMDLNSRYPPAGSLFNNVRGRPGTVFFCVPAPAVQPLCCYTSMPPFLPYALGKYFVVHQIIKLAPSGALSPFERRTHQQLSSLWVIKTEAARTFLVSQDALLVPAISLRKCTLSLVAPADCVLRSSRGLIVYLFCCFCHPSMVMTAGRATGQARRRRGNTTTRVVRRGW